MENTRKFVWVDLEMTGLNSSKDVILEVGIVVTDNNCNPLHKTRSYVLYQNELVLQNMGEWCRQFHTASGLVQAVRTSTLTEKDVEASLVTIIQQYAPEKSGILAGNSIWQDRIFLSKYMPKIFDVLHYRLLDVSSIKELALAWYGDSIKYKKKETHRATEDIEESIQELLHYKKNIFNKKNTL